MASKTYIQHYAGGTRKLVRRSLKQGRKSCGLGTPFLQRLFEQDEEILLVVKEKLGYLYNKNDFVRNAVKYYINSVYTELLKP